MCYCTRWRIPQETFVTDDTGLGASMHPYSLNNISIIRSFKSKFVYTLLPEDAYLRPDRELSEFWLKMKYTDEVVFITNGIVSAQNLHHWRNVISIEVSILSDLYSILGGRLYVSVFFEETFTGDVFPYFFDDERKCLKTCHQTY